MTTPRAILAGAALIAVAVYFGLRASSAPRPATSATAAASSATITPPPSAVPVTASSADLQTVVAAALGRHRQALRERCAATGAVVRLTFDFTFAADGTQLGRGVSEGREAGSPKATACVLEHLPPLKLAPIGRMMKARVVFELP